jgi:hypothetical protein
MLSDIKSGKPHGPHLSDDEKARVREWANERESKRHPSAKITITVVDELDAGGRARYKALVLTEEVADGVVIIRE